MVVADRVDSAASNTVAELCDNGVQAMKVLVDLGSLGAANAIDELSEAVVRANRRSREQRWWDNLDQAVS